MMARIFGKKVIAFLIFLAAVNGAEQTSAAGKGVYTIDPARSSIEGSIKYTVIGRYRAVFESFQGAIAFNDEKNTIESVWLEIAASSIKSPHPMFDNIVRSRQLLHVERYPQIRFQSKSIRPVEDGYEVFGTLDLHGVQKEISFPFQLERIQSDRKSPGHLKASGVWVINRKDFKVIWNKILDQGGILVGNEITVDWEVVADAG